MAIGYRAVELLELAQQMERNGCAFYTQAAALNEGKVKRMLLELADMERVHERTFADMAADLPEDEGQAPGYDPEGQAVQYVRAVVGGHVFDLRADPVEWLARGRTLPEIIRKAIGLERDTIIYYLGVRELLSGIARDRMDDVIEQEKGHVIVLTDQLREVEGE